MSDDGRVGQNARDLSAPALLGDGAESAEVGISIYDDDGRMVAVNAHACELLGYQREELLQHDIADFTEGGIDRSVLKSPHRREGVRLVTRKDGSKVPVAFLVVPTRVAGIPFYFAISWQLDTDDARAVGAS
jgi:PAS domain S-box-containing protein